MYQVSQNNMRVQKRNGEYEEVSFDKIMKRIKSLSTGSEFSLKLRIDETLIAQKVVQEIYDGVKTSELDELASQIAISMYSKDPEFKILAGRIVISNHHKATKNTFSEKIDMMYKYEHFGKSKPLIADYLYEMVQSHKEKIDGAIDYSKDYDYDFFGFKTLEKSYLYRVDKLIVERPQDMLMRVSLAIWRDDISAAIHNYKLMSSHYFTHATPTLYNAGSRREQFASCFLLTMKDDSITGIYDTLKDCAVISKHAGGIGLSLHDIRAEGSYIAGTNGQSNGLVPMLRVFNDTARYVDQGGGKRNGSFAMYLEPWHADIFEFIELKKNHGNEFDRARDLFYALWVPDLFMERLHSDGKWSLFCPHECPGLSDVWGSEFVKLYSSYEDKGLYRKQIDARELWQAIITSQIEVGTPYILYKDACNMKSNQQNLGTIKSSNLCTEIIEFTSPEETAVCNLASISLKKFVKKKDTSGLHFLVYTKTGCVYCDLAKALLKKKNVSYEDKSHSDHHPISEETTWPRIYVANGECPADGVSLVGGYTELNDYLRPSYDFRGLEDISGQLCRNLNNIIDNNFYPTKETKTSNTRHRPIGIGVQGLADVFFMFGYAFDSREAKLLNEQIFETIYYGAMVSSMTLAKERADLMKQYKECAVSMTPRDLRERLGLIVDGEVDRDEYLGSYSSFIGSPLHQGKFQFDLWQEAVTDERHDWSSLMKEIQIHGTRNSLLLAPMPTASTAQILGNYECFEPIMSNIYTRRVLSGEYMVINDYLVEDLISLDLWSTALKDKIIGNDGSVLNIDEIPQLIQLRYKTVWEIKQKNIVDMALDRGKFICQSQSMNLFLESPSVGQISSMHSYSWKKGLKTGIYYLRSRPSSKAIQFTIAPDCENCSG